MNMTRLIKMLPMLVMVASLAYAAYSIQPVVSSLTPAAGAAKAGKQAVVEGAGQAVTAAGSPEASPAVRVAGRNPFQVAAKPDRIEDGKNSTPELEKTDSYLAALEGLTLNATFLQGRTQMAIIDGRIYEPGQNLVGANDEPSPLVVAQVLVNKVVFQAEGQALLLGLPRPARSINCQRGGRQCSSDQGSRCQEGRPPAGQGFQGEPEGEGPAALFLVGGPVGLVPIVSRGIAPQPRIDIDLWLQCLSSPMFDP